MSFDVLINSPKVSVIIPVYNSELYLENCLRSVLCQTLQEIEILLIDDGSKDRSGAICDEYSKTDDRIVVIHQENQGICGARNTGLKIARGEYITFCDNDDYVSPNCYELTYSYAKKYDADVVRFRRKHTMIGKMGRITTSYLEFQNHEVMINDWEDYLDVISKTGYGVWAGIYRRSILASGMIDFDTHVKYGYEDNIFSAKIYRYAKKVFLINNELYDWIQRDNHSASKKKGYDVFINRFDGMILWKEAEDLLYNSLTDKNNLHKERIYDYLRMVIEEIANSGIKGRESVRAMEYAKEKLGFIPKEKSNFEERMINNNQNQLFMSYRYLKVLKRKLIQIYRQHKR